MIRNYFKIAWRSITRHKVYTLINVLGLALGICSCLCIYTLTQFEFSFDTFHPDKDRIYRIVAEVQDKNGAKQYLDNVPPHSSTAIREEISGMETVAGFLLFYPRVTIPTEGYMEGNQADKAVKKFNNAKFCQIIIAEPQYFDIFNYTWLAGNAQTALKKPFSVVLTENRARQYFGSGSLDKMIGKVVVYEDSLPVSVLGIVKDWEQNTDFGFTDFISSSTAQKSSFLKSVYPLDNWGSIHAHNSEALVKLTKGTSPEQANAQFAALVKKHIRLDAGTTYHMQLQPLSDVHFNADYLEHPRRKAHLPTLYGLMGIAGFILLIAAINFINLSTAQSIKRAKEIGIRKVLGSNRASLVFQFLTETFVLTGFAVVVSVLLVKPVLATFRSFIPSGVSFDLFRPATLLFLLLLTLITTFLAGFYPAKVLSAYLPALTLKGSTTHKGSQQWYLRKALIVFQFTVSLLFIIGTLVIGNQIRFMQGKDKGFQTDAIVTFQTNWREDSNQKVQVLAQKITQIPGIDRAILQLAPPMSPGRLEDLVTYKGKNQVEISVGVQSGNEDFIPFYGMKLVAGRNLLPSDSLRELVINEACVKAMGFTNPTEAVSRLLYFRGKAYPIVGVVADFHQVSFREPIKPLVLGNMPEYQHGIALKLATQGKGLGEVKAILSQVEQQFKEIYPDWWFEYSFFDEWIARLYESEQKTAMLLKVAMGVTIFISCLGLFGLALFTAELKTKEIAIRKVLGATVTDIATMLSKEFVILVLIAILIASPIAWYLANRWLEDFVYRIQIRGWVFVLAGAGAILIALLTVSFQAMKAARANPVKSLRAE